MPSKRSRLRFSIWVRSDMNYPLIYRRKMSSDAVSGVKLLKLLPSRHQRRPLHRQRLNLNPFEPLPFHRLRQLLKPSCLPNDDRQFIEGLFPLRPAPAADRREELEIGFEGPFQEAVRWIGAVVEDENAAGGDHSGEMGDQHIQVGIFRKVGSDAGVE